MIVDLHCHTKKCKTGDPPERNVSAQVFVDAVLDAGVGIAAITNHNCFDLDQFQEFSEAANGDFQLWPGVELDVTNSTTGRKWHMLVIASPINLREFATATATLVGESHPDGFSCDFTSVFSAYAGLDVLFVSHCHDKEPFISDEDMRCLQSAVSAEHQWQLFYEPRSLVTVGIWSAFGRQMLIGSDVQDWSSYSDCELPELRLPVDSFEQFTLLAKRDRSVIESTLDSVTTTNRMLIPHSGIEVEVPIYNDINVIFGQKGTGKTEMLKSLKAALGFEGAAISFYSGSDKNNEFDKLTVASGVSRDAAQFGRIDCIGEIDSIRQWTEPSPTPLKKYISWVKTRTNKGNKARFKIADAAELHPVSDGHSAHLKVVRAVGSFMEVIADNADIYLDEDERTQFMSLLALLRNRALDKARESYIESKCVALANSGLGKLKGELRKRAAEEPKPGSTGFAAFALAYAEIAVDVETVKANMAPAEVAEEEPLGHLDDKGALAIQTRWRYYDSKVSRSPEFNSKLKDIKEWVAAFDKLHSSLGSERLPSAVSDFASICADTGITSLESLIGVSKVILREDTRKEYVPSNGEKGILLLGKRLSDEADYYLLDEPETGMSNSFIATVILPKIYELAKSGKTVVMVTHNANLAVRTLPYCSIYREHITADDYRTFVGNPFVNELVDVKDQESKLSWSEMSIRALEGGHDAFYGRKSVYEAGGINGCN